MYKVIRIIQGVCSTAPRNIKRDKKKPQILLSWQTFLRQTRTSDVRCDEVFRAPDTRNYICLRSNPIKEKKKEKNTTPLAM